MIPGFESRYDLFALKVEEIIRQAGGILHTLYHHPLKRVEKKMKDL